MFRILAASAVMCLTAPAAVMADAHSGMAAMVKTGNQSVANGIVSAKDVIAPENGWLVVHRTDAAMKPGYVVGHAPLRKGHNKDVAAILTEPVNPGEMLMLMVHSEAGGNFTGIFEYSLGAKEDGPIKPDGKLVMKVITAK